MPTKIKQSKSQKIPKLRFAGFCGGSSFAKKATAENWEEKRLGEVASFLKGRGISKNDIVENGKNKCIRYGELYTKYDEVINEVVSRTNEKKENFVLSEKDDLIIPSSGETSLDIATISCVKDKNIILGGDLNIIRLKENNVGDFFAYYLSNYKKKEIAKFGQGHSVVHLYSSHFKNLKINIPEKEEQQKIAKFLGAVDEWIENLRAQKENLEDYKKGMMQKIFPSQGGQVSEIRFKDDDGNGFAEWEEKRLGEIGKSFSGLTGKSGEDFGSGESFITYKQIFDDSKINIDKFALVNVNKNEKQNKAQFGDIFFTTSSETPLEVGFASVLLNKNADPYLNSFSFGFRPNSLKEFDPYYARFFFRSSVFRKEVVKLAQGSTRYNISKLSFMKIKVLFPSFPEQQKIAEFLTSIDNLINSKQQQITQAEEWKKGLMQGLFV